MIITTGHSNVDYGLVVENAKLVFDTRNALHGFKASNIHKLGSL